MHDRRVLFNIALLLGIAAIIIFFRLGSLPLLDPDEPVYAETAREMIQYHDFISPRIYGDFWYDKPPMYYWLAAGAFKLFGSGEFAARFPSALLAVAGAVLVYLSGRKLFNERAGLLSGLVLATSLEYFYLGKAAVTDITLTFFLTAALLAFLHGRYYLLYACAALAVVTKGPIGVVFCGAIIGLYLLVTRNLALLSRMKVFSGAVLFSFIALPWYLVMYHYHGMAFIDTFLGFHNVTRFLQPEHAAGRLWYYYIPVLILGFFPWTAFLVQAVNTGIRERGRNRNYSLFLIIWAAVVFGFFTLSQTKLVSYILPMYPPLALLVGRYFDEAWTERRYAALKWPAITLAALAVLFEAGFVYAAELIMPSLLPPVKAMAAVFALMVASVAWLSYRRKFGAVFAANVAGVFLFVVVLLTQLMPVAAPALSVESLVSEFRQHYDGQAPVYVAKFYRPGFMFYSGLPGKELQPEDVPALIGRPAAKAYFILQKKHFERLEPSLKSKVQLLAAVEDKVLFVRGAE